MNQAQRWRDGRQEERLWNLLGWTVVGGLALMALAVCVSGIYGL